MEEPEAGLDPYAQLSMLEELTRIILAEPVPGRDGSLLMTTHSPYILNYLNVLLERYNKPGACSGKVRINPESLAVYKIEGGTAESLVLRENDHYYVDTNWFSEPMNRIYGEYENLLEPLRLGD